MTIFLQKIQIQKRFGQKSKTFFRNLFSKYFIVIGGLVLAPFLYAQNDFSDSKAWHYLGKYQEIFYNRYESQIDDPRFFLAKNGKNNPKAEWKATLTAFKKGEHFCDYPARLKLFQDNGYQFSSDLSKCNDWNYFKKQTNVKKIWIVFASYYVNNPASAFGHTFLRFQANETKPSDLLDFSLDYSANVPDGENPILYATKGIVGTYPASYKLFPYYWKVREYLDGESRDLWEYELKLKPKQIEYLMAHLWELRKFYSDYYYFTENCSYHVLGLIQAVVPEKKILSPLHKIVIPIDTLFSLRDSDLLGSRRFRLSLFSRLEKHWEKLSVTQKEKFNRLLANNEEVTQETDPQIYDAFIEYYDKFHYVQLLDDNSEEKFFKNKILSQRSRLPVNNIKIEYNKEDPVFGHRGRRFSFGADSNNKFVFQYKSSLHQLVDPSFGYGSNFHMDLGEAQFKLDDDIEIHQLTLLKIKAFKPITPINTEFSWDLDSKIQRNYLSEKLMGMVNFSGGGAVNILNTLAYLGLGIEARTYEGIFRRGDFGYGPKFNLRYEYFKLTFLFEYELYRFENISNIFDRYSAEVGYKIQERWNFFIKYKEEEKISVTDFRLALFF